MRTGLKDSKQLINLLKQLEFNSSIIESIDFISDEIKVPIFTLDIKNQNSEKEIINYNRDFIFNYYSAVYDKLNLLEATEEIIIDFNNFHKGDIQSNYLIVVQDIINRTGKYQVQHDLIYELTHYVSTISVCLRTVLERKEDKLSPNVIYIVKLEAENKFDKKLNKVLELDISKLN